MHAERDLHRHSTRHKAAEPTPGGGLALRSQATGALALGAAAWGALALGALAVGMLAVGRLRVGRAHADRVKVRELNVDRLEVGDLIVRHSSGLAPKPLGAGTAEPSPSIFEGPPGTA